MISEEQIQAVVRRIVEGYAPDKIILFGSYAYDVPQEHSDLDLLLIKEKAEAKRVERSINVWQLLWEHTIPLMDIPIRMPTEMEKAAGIFQSVETIAQTQGRPLYAAEYTRAAAR